MNTTAKTVLGGILLLIVVIGGGWLLYSHAQERAAENVKDTPQASTPAAPDATVVTSTTTTSTTVKKPPVSNPPKPAPVHASLAISSIAPSKGPVGTEVTLRGSGFTSTRQVIVGQGAISNVTVNAAGTVLSFTMPSSAGAYCVAGHPCAMYLLLLQPGTYDLSVRNVDGKDSNSVQFTLTGSSNPTI